MPAARTISKRKRRDHHEASRSLINLASTFSDDEKVMYRINKTLQNHARKVAKCKRDGVDWSVEDCVHKMERLIRKLPQKTRRQAWRNAGPNLQMFYKLEKIVANCEELEKDTRRKRIITAIMKKERKRCGKAKDVSDSEDEEETLTRLGIIGNRGDEGSELEIEVPSLTESEDSTEESESSEEQIKSESEK
ncbi:unnamed protein product [Caenorhabditis bovis]|uniref:Uncharacterized protein n=1 Tax=Caenorhabditis bovis TaxID=2654633 RepID=A0A8S1EQV9_9PELO|nr:unnamed protein product [Caenorhabditis bovis]